MHTSVDPALCNGCRICEIICPEVFQMVQENGRLLAIVIHETVPPAAENFCRDARDCCPTHAVAIRFPIPKR